MKQICLAVSLLLLVAAGHAQVSATGSITAEGTTCATTNACVSLPLVNSINASSGGVGIVVSANAGSNTLSFEGTADGVTWVALNATPLNSTSPATSTTSTGTWQANVAGLVGVRVRCSSYSSGTSVVSIQASTASARLGGGGAGSGTVTLVSGTSHQVDVASGTTTPVLSLDSALQLPGSLAYAIFTAPTAPTATLVSISAQNCTAGAHAFAVMFVNANGRTNYGAASGSVTCDGTHTEVALSAIPLGPAGTTSRDICATKAAGSVYYLASNGEPTLNDNTTTTFTFNVADTTLNTGNFVPCPIADNSTAGVVSSQFAYQVVKGSVVIGLNAGQNAIPLAASNTWNNGYPTAPYNTFVGEHAGQIDTPSGTTCETSFKNGTWNTLIGGDAGLGLITGCLNTVMGGDSVHDNDIGNANVAIGVDALQSAAAGVNHDTAVGVRSGANDSGGDNTFLGYKAGQSNTSAVGVTYVGDQAGANGTTGKQNTCVGFSACSGALVDGSNAGSFVTAVGYDADPVGTGAYNTVIGDEAGKGLTTGFGNSLLGFSSGIVLTTGTENTCIGRESCKAEVSVSNNVMVGFWAGILETGAGNVLIGSQAGAHATSGATNVIIGTQVGNTTITTGSSNVLIGTSSAVDLPVAAQSNYLNIQNFLIGDTSKGILIWRGPTTTIAANACGSSTQGTLKAGSNDISGEVTVGTAAVTSCAVSFANTHTAAPNCIVTSQVAGTVVGFGYTASTTALTVTATSAFDGTVFDYYCPGAATATNPTP